MSRGGVNWTEEEFAEYERLRKGGDALAPSKRSGTAPVASTAGAKKPRMNKWECEYALELEARKHAGEILWYGFEALKLRLADGTYYTPDFAVLAKTKAYALGAEWVPGETAMHFVEIKGFLRDDANVKFKVAAELFPFELFMYTRKKGGGWELMKHLNGGGR